MRRLVLKPGKDKAIRNYHHWIFSGAIESLEKTAEDGSVVAVYAHGGERLGSAYINRRSSITGRMIAFGDTPWENAIGEAIDGAIHYRLALFSGAETTAYRLIHGEGDRLPGLVVDRYGHTLVMQISTLGMEKLRSVVTSLITAVGNGSLPVYFTVG